MTYQKLTTIYRCVLVYVTLLLGMCSLCVTLQLDLSVCVVVLCVLCCVNSNSVKQ